MVQVPGSASEHPIQLIDFGDYMEETQHYSRSSGAHPAPQQFIVAHVHTFVVGTGGDRVSELEALSLAAGGHKVIIVAPIAPSIAARLREANIDIYDVPPEQRTAATASRVLGQLHIVHCHCMVSAPFAAELARKTGAALIIHNHSIGEEWWEAATVRSWLRPARRRRRVFIDSAIASAERVLCVSGPVLNHMRGLGLCTERAEVVPNPISNDFALQPEAPVIKFDVCVVARATRQKSPLTTLRILAHAKKLDPRLRIVWIGELGRWGRILRVGAILLGLRDIQFHGAVDPSRVRFVLDSSRVLLSASKQEGFGVAVLEALTRGCSALLSDIPAHREAFSQIGGTRFFSHRKVKPAAKMLVELVKDHVRKPREWLASKYSAEEHGRRIEQVYIEVLARRD